MVDESIRVRGNAWDGEKLVPVEFDLDLESAKKLGLTDMGPFSIAKERDGSTAQTPSAESG